MQPALQCHAARSNQHGSLKQLRAKDIASLLQYIDKRKQRKTPPCAAACYPVQALSCETNCQCSRANWTCQKLG